MPCFVMNSSNLIAIRKSYYYLVRKGFNLEHLKNLERHEFEFYIEKLNDEIDEMSKQMEKSN